MLNETWRLWQALERTPSLRLERKHKRVPEPGRSAPCLRVRLNSQGKVVAIEEVTYEDWPSWTVMEGNQNSFPVVRVQHPLLEVSVDVWQELGFHKHQSRRRTPDDAQRVKTLEEASQKGSVCLWSKRTHDLWERLRDRKANELVNCAQQMNDQGQVVAALGERFVVAAQQPDTLLSSIGEVALARLKQGTLSAIDPVEQLLVGKGPPDANGRRPTMTVQLAFDVSDPDRFSHPLYSEKIRILLRKHLPREPTWKRSHTQKNSETLGIDALTGEAAALERETLPKIGLPVYSRRKQKIGRKPFPLSSMFSAARCNYRYGLTDANVFPVAKTHADRLKEALEFITADSRQGQTWEFVGSGRFKSAGGQQVEKPDVFIAYVEDSPGLDANTARYIGGGMGVDERRFEVDAAALVVALKGVVRQHPKSRLQLFAIREMSKGQAQVVLAESPTVQQVLSAAEQWVRAVKENVPPVRLCLKEELRDGEMKCVAWGQVFPPYPDQVVRLLSHQWARGGRQSSAVVGPGLGEVLDVMLRPEGKGEAAAQQMVGRLVQRLSPLLIGVFGAQHAYGPRKADKRHEPLFDYPRSSREAALRAVAVSAILLDALGHRKEQYMKNAPYQVGQVLALADTLHKDYCTVVRKGQLPNSLIGTALMRRALDNPAAAVADLGERMMEYVRWAKTAQTPQGKDKEQQRIAVNEARKKLRQYQPLAAALGAADLPIEVDEVAKAQLFLGFLASPPDEQQDQNGKDSIQ